MSAGLFASNDVCANSDPNSSYFIRKDEPIIIDTLIANEVITDTIDLNGGILTTTTGGTILTLNGNPVGGGQVDTITGTAPITVTGTATDPVISLADSTVVPATYTLATVTVNNKGLVTSASSNTIPDNSDWSNFPALTPVNMNNFKLTSLATPTLATDGTTKGYVDGLDAQNVKLTGNQNIAGIKTFSSVPVCSTLPTTNDQLANKQYVDGLDAQNVKLTGNQTIAGIKTFSSIPVCSTLPTTNDQLANKQYVDSAVSADTLANVLIAGNSAGTNQINMNNNKIIGLATPTLATDAVTKGYTDGLDAQNVKLTGDQTIAGIKTFSSVPVCSTLPTTNSQLANKQYVDSVAGGVPTLGQVLTAGNTASGDINMNGFDISSVNDITMSGLAPTITATNILGNLTLSALGTFNALTGGQMTLASGGIMSIGGATHTSIENVRIDNSAITKDSGADLTIGNVATIGNVSATQTFANTTNGDVDISMAGTGALHLIQNSVGGTSFPVLKLQTNTTDSTGVDIDLYHNKVGVPGDRTGVLSFSGNNSVGTKSLFGRIRGEVVDATAGSVDGDIEFAVANNNTLTTTLVVNGTGIKPTTILDTTNLTGTPGQVLSSTGTGLQWVASGGGGGYAGTVETLVSPGTLSSFVENSQIAGIGDYTLGAGIAPNQRKLVTFMPGPPKSMRQFFQGAANNGSFAGLIQVAVYDPVLQIVYFGGTFTNTPDGRFRPRIASYSPVTNLFYNVGTGVNAPVTALYLDSAANRLYVGGSFTNAGGVVGANRLARWDITGLGTGAWGIIGGTQIPTSGQVNTIVRFNADQIYVGGTFAAISGIASTNLIARYSISGNNFTAVSSGFSTTLANGPGATTVNTIFVDGTRLYIGGNYFGALTAGVLTPDTPNICYFDTLTNSYVRMGRGTLPDAVTSITKYDGEIVIACGISCFPDTLGAAPVLVERVASWNPSTLVWKPIGDSLTNIVNSLNVFDGVLYAVGSMAQVINSQDGGQMQRLAKWDPIANKWRTFGGVNGTVFGIIQIGAEFAVFGTFNRTFTFEAFGQNQNMAYITPANFSRLISPFFTTNGFITEYFQFSAGNTVNTMEFLWNQTTNKWVQMRDGETIPNA